MLHKYCYQSIKSAFVLLATIVVLNACNSSPNKPADSRADTTATATANTVGENWVYLLDGVSKTNWHTYDSDSVGAAWKVDDNAWHLDASNKKDWQTSGGGDLVTNDEYDNFDLKLEWKISEGGNSGII